MVEFRCKICSFCDRLWIFNFKCPFNEKVQRKFVHFFIVSDSGRSFFLYDFFIINVFVYQMLLSFWLDLVCWLHFIFLFNHLISVELLWFSFLHMNYHAAIILMAVCYVFSLGHIQAIDGVRDLSHSTTSSVTLNHWWKDCLNWHMLIWIVYRLELEIVMVVSGDLRVNIWNLRYIVEVVHFTNLCFSLTLVMHVWSIVSSQRVSMRAWIILTLFRHNNFFIALIGAKLLVSGSIIF